MRKLIVGFVGVGAVLALRPLVKRRIVRKMPEHCRQMMGQFSAMRETPGRREAHSDPS